VRARCFLVLEAQATLVWTPPDHSWSPVELVVPGLVLDEPARRPVPARLGSLALGAWESRVLVEQPAG
jgi:hypothetical protein